MLPKMIWPIPREIEYSGLQISKPPYKFWSQEGYRIKMLHNDQRVRNISESEDDILISGIPKCQYSDLFLS